MNSPIEDAFLRVENNTRRRAIRLMRESTEVNGIINFVDPLYDSDIREELIRLGEDPNAGNWQVEITNRKAEFFDRLWNELSA